jgi:hypothetical protein
MGYMLSVTFVLTGIQFTRIIKITVFYNLSSFLLWLHILKFIGKFLDLGYLYM